MFNDCSSEFTNSEADITICRYMIKAADEGSETLTILSDDTDVFDLSV